MTKTYCDVCGIDTDNHNYGYIYGRLNALTINMSVTHVSHGNPCPFDICARCAIKVLEAAIAEREGGKK